VGQLVCSIMHIMEHLKIRLQDNFGPVNALQHTSGNKKAEEDANKDAEAQMKSIHEAGKKGQDKVVADLLKAVFDVKPRVPERVEMPS
jgi:hypothetical protein